MLMRLTGAFHLSSVVSLCSLIANDNCYGDADFIAANLATTKLTAALAMALAHDESAS
jgi:hypothetical protein